MSKELKRLPTLQELTQDSEVAFKQDALNMILNQPTPINWIKKHPFVNIDVATPDGGKQKQALEYIPVDKVKFMLTRIFQEWHTEIVDYKALFNAVSVHVRLKVKNPVTGEWIIHDGVAAVDVQTKSGASPADLAQINSSAVMKSLPAAASYALKNAAEKLGGIFGGNLQKYDVQQFSGAYMNPVTLEDVKTLWEEKNHLLTAENQVFARRIIDNQEANSYQKLYSLLQSVGNDTQPA